MTDGNSEATQPVFRSDRMRVADELLNQIDSRCGFCGYSLSNGMVHTNGVCAAKGVLEGVSMYEIDRLIAGRNRSLVIYPGKALSVDELYTLTWDYAKNQAWLIISPRGNEIACLIPVIEGEE